MLTDELLLEPLSGTAVLNGIPVELEPGSAAPGAGVASAMPGTVAVLGGGVAGLSAAHELIERGFAVTVYESTARFGGKARSYAVPDRGPTGGATCRPSTAFASSRASTATCPTR